MIDPLPSSSCEVDHGWKGQARGSPSPLSDYLRPLVIQCHLRTVLSVRACVESMGGSLHPMITIGEGTRSEVGVNRL
jgi:hypothetical protein